MFSLVEGIKAVPPEVFFSIIIPVKGVISVQFPAIEAKQINVSSRVAEEAGSATSPLLFSGGDVATDVCTADIHKRVTFHFRFHDDNN